MNRCERCDLNKAKVRFQMDEKSTYLCIHCYNELMAEELEVDLEQLIEIFSVKDYQGVSRTFYVERRVHPNGILLEATENVEFGYKFAVHGELNSNQQEMLYKLIEKTRKGTGEQQVETKFFPNGQAYNDILNDQIKGLIEYDETSDGTPIVIIDGKPFTWEEVGKMLMTYEGFQMKLTIYDPTDDVE
ncbi:DUF7713 domain-containing protein [Mesobacillus maritimus]|uniref:Uncharacterized protein n=1 Tax=Mesobacillus maritimus TaxID=1643336 RepID=A0ABS7K515_9BACI|nr:hypothetical protein [Mesobacillus maritimus]MBY0097315.1 hypothetical protein [Mesobacillus maritimus]